jgi:hypothetical protein
MTGTTFIRKDRIRKYDKEAGYNSSNAQYMYTGSADPGSATSSAVWRISRYDFSSGVTEYADGDQEFDNIWDNRESLSYS